MLTIISGGQTGADRTALEIAHGLGFQTGGFAPKGYRTELGPDPDLKDKYGLEEAKFDHYPYRTKLNVEAANLTVWFGKVNTLGFKCVFRAAGKCRRDFIANPDAETLLRILVSDRVKVLNVTGNRLSKNPGIIRIVHDVLGEALSRYKRMEREAETDPSIISAPAPNAEVS